MTGYNIRQFMADGRTLRCYLSGGLPSFANIRQNLYLSEREIGFRRPDHFYKNWIKHDLGETERMAPHHQISAYLKACFDGLTKPLLTIQNNLVKVEPLRFETWQALLPRVPPLPLMSFRLYRHFNLPESVGEYTEYCLKRLVPNFCRTALPSPHTPHMDKFVNNNGLIDVHLHLNGTTEMDRAWLHILSFPDDFQTSLTDEILENNIVKEQFDQIEEGISINRIHYRIRLASWLRYSLIQRMLKAETPDLLNFQHYINEEFRLLEDPGYSLRTHPLADGLPGLHEFNDSVLESLFHIMMFRYMDRHPANDTVARAYHLYLLILGFFNKLMVQQVEQFGFDQFQKITLNKCRDSVEKEYADRFFQICGNEENHLTLLEGRFAPKDTIEKNIGLLDRIFNGYQSYHGVRDAFTSITQDAVVEIGQRMRLSLTAHFIKERDMEWQNGELLVRHHALRQSLEQKARAIIYLCSELNRVKEILHGIDAASNELQASPEVFAPIYRRLRRNGFRHFTYHSGEDFAHLLSGVRTLFEAVEFLELQSGDRIGHATALGILNRQLNT
nr:hypothetical protein [uncultured Desulfobacter sp.]